MENKKLIIEDTGMYCESCDVMLTSDNMFHSESEQCMTCIIGKVYHE